MPKYDVYLSAVVPTEGHVAVEAENEEKAKQLALRAADSDSAEWEDSDSIKDMRVVEVRLANEKVAGEDVWGNNSIQFPRILAELQGLVTFDQMRELSELTDLSERELEELFERAIRAWEDIKAERRHEDADRMQEEHDRQMAGAKNSLSLEKLIQRYGPLKPIGRDRADQLCQTGHAGRVFCLHRTNDGVLYGQIGFHIVDVDERYEMPKLAPLNLDIYGCADVDLSEEAS